MSEGLDGPTGQVALIPLSPAEIVDEGFDLFKRHFRLFFGIVAVVDVPFGIFQFVLFESLGLRATLEGVESDGGPATQQAIVGATVVFIFIAFFQSLAMIVEGAALTSAVSNVYLGRPTGIRQAYRQVMRRWWNLLSTWFLIALIAAGVAFGALFGFAIVFGAFAAAGAAGLISDVVGVVIGLLLGMAVAVLCVFGFVSVGICASQIVMIENLSFGQAVQRNWNLVRRRFGRIAGFALLLFVVVTAFETALVYSAEYLLDGTLYGFVNLDSATQFAITTTLQTLASMFASPFLMTSITLLYYDLRVRREGFDLSLLERRWAEIPT